MNICRKLISGNVGRATLFTYCSRYLSTLPPAISVATRRYFSTLPPAAATSAATSDGHTDFEDDVASYIKSLRNWFSCGVPHKWAHVHAYFEHEHRQGIEKIQAEKNYKIKTLISVESYMHLYLRCTYADLRGVFEYFRSNEIGIAVGKYATGHVIHRPHFIRLSALSVSNKPNIMLRADASVVGRCGGYGFIFTDSDDRFLDWDLGNFDNLGRGLVLTDRVTLLELYAINQALCNYKFIEAAKHGFGLRILSDCYNAVDILNGKPAVTSTATDVTNTYYNKVMDSMCSFGIQIKKLGLSDYSASHMYRELNGSGDFLSHMGRLLKNRPTGEELTERGKFFNVVRQFNKSVPPVVPPVARPSP